MPHTKSDDTEIGSQDRTLPKWRKPVLTETGIVESTQFTRNRPVDDGARQFGSNYATYGIGS